MFSKGKLILYPLPTIISVLILSVAFPNPTIMIYQQEASAQMTDNTFKRYQNPTYGIQIQHPSDWRIDEGDVYADDYVTDIVSFIAPIRSDTESYAPSLSISIDNPPPPDCKKNPKPPECIPEEDPCDVDPTAESCEDPEPIENPE